MSFGSFAQAPAIQAEMNTTPLVDVLLVLLVVFILASPVLTHAVKLDLPYGDAPTTQTRTIALAIDAQGELSWDKQAISDAELLAQLRTLQGDDHVQLQIAAEPGLRYERLVQVIALAQQHGIRRLGFAQ